MLKAHVAVAHPQGDWSNVCCVGCDEMSVRKGHRYVSVFCDLIAKRVLFATPGKDKRTGSCLPAPWKTTSAIPGRSPRFRWT
jgi:hypothetical protein